MMHAISANAHIRGYCTNYKHNCGRTKDNTLYYDIPRL